MKGRKVVWVQYGKGKESTGKGGREGRERKGGGKGIRGNSIGVKRRK